jgi:hypothetical protein
MITGRTIGFVANQRLKVSRVLLKQVLLSSALLVTLSQATEAQQARGKKVVTLQFPTTITAPLLADASIVGDGLTLRGTLTRLSQQSNVYIALDRRLDPGKELGVTELGPQISTSLDLIAKDLGVAWVAAEDVVLVGPSESVQGMATELIGAWHSLQNSLEPTNALLKSQTVAWPQLTTPQEALNLIAQRWQLDIQGIQLPHDLWPETTMNDVRVTSALGVVLMGFDLGYDIDPMSRRVLTRPLKNDFVVTKLYPSAPLPADLRRSFSSNNGRARVQKLKEIATGWELTGNASEHWRLEQAIFTQGAKRRGAGTQEESRYTLRLEQKPAAAVFVALAAQGQYKLEVDDRESAKLKQPISLVVEDKKLLDILEEVARQADVRVRVDGNILYVVTLP